MQQSVVTNPQMLVKEFHQKFGHPVATIPGPLTDEQKELRLALIKEEVVELAEALWDDDLVESYDACLDILYVVYGTLVALGLEAAPGFAEVQASNLSKLGEYGTPLISRGMAEDGLPKGKIMKGPLYFKPDLKSIVEKQIKEAQESLGRDGLF